MSYGADWKQVDARVIELGREGAKHNREVCRWLAEAERLGVPGRLGFASLREYAERRLGLKGREGEERVRVGKALADLPGLDEAFAAGKLFWSAVREMTRVVVPETEAAWLAWAVSKSVGQVERQVSGRKLGDRPSDRVDPSLVKHRLSFKVRAETFAMFRELQAGIREELGGGDTDDDLLLHEIMRRALGGGGAGGAGGRGEEGGEAGGEDVGRAPYQVAVSRCDACQLVSIDAAGDSFPVDAVIEKMIRCDAQEIPHVGASKQRATQTVPPARRREVMRRERNCCAMPGCRNHRHLHVHHVKPRSEGGDHDPAWLVPLCHRHHSQVHDGTVVVTGNAEDGFVFRHADGARYGESPDAAAVELAQRAFATLCAMGFKMTEARKLIDRVQHDGAPDTLEAFVHAALRAS